MEGFHSAKETVTQYDRAELENRCEDHIRTVQGTPEANRKR